MAPISQEPEILAHEQHTKALEGRNRRQVPGEAWGEVFGWLVGMPLIASLEAIFLSV